MIGQRSAVALVCALLAFVSGCIVIHPNGSGEVYRRRGEKISSKIVRVPSFTGVQVSLQRLTQTTAELSLNCSGEFVLEDTYDVAKQHDSCNCLAIGLFPSFAQADVDEYLLLFTAGLILVPCANCCFLFIPTIDTLFFEPFQSDYYSKDGITGCARFGLVGCYKYTGKRTWFVFDETEKVSSTLSDYCLNDYAFRVNGKRYECPASQGKMIVALPSGARTAEVVIERVPEFDGEFGQYLKGLVGVPLTVEVK